MCAAVRARPSKWVPRTTRKHCGECCSLADSFHYNQRTLTGSRFINPSLNKPNWFLSHWRGEASLGVAYWLNGLLLGYLLPAGVTFGFIFLNPLGNYPRVNDFAVLILTVAQLVLWVWVVVGIVRSANRHTDRGGKLFWANVARVLMGISVLGMGFSLHNRIFPEIRLLSSLAAGHDPFGVVDVQTSADGQIISVDGTIGQGSLDKLQEVLAASPNATTVLLNSDGGREKEAESMSALIRKRQLNTSVEDHCLSACTLVFLGGSKRDVAEDAQLGFHQSTGLVKTDFEQQIAIQEMRQSYRALGVREWFIDRIVATPPDSMWYPTKDELKSAGVLN